MFSSPKFAAAQNWRLFFRGQSFRIVSDAFSPLSQTIVNKRKWLSVLFIQLWLLIFDASSLSIQLLKRRLCLRQNFDAPGRPGHLTLDRQISPVLWWKSKLCSLRIIRNTTLFIFEIKCVRFPPYPRTTCLCKHPVRFLSIGLTWIIDFSFPCVWRSDSLCIFNLPYCTDITDIHRFCVLNSIVSYDQSKCVIKIDAFDWRWAFVASQNFQSIVIIVPLHVSKSSRVPKKLTA
jgi:hypothetical protein